MRQRTKTSVGKRIIAGLQEFVDALQKPEPVQERFTCRKVVLDLKPSSYDALQVRQTRQLLCCSQAVFARFLGVSVRTVRSWEQGTNPPSDLACRFMDEIRRDPKYWLRRLQNAIVMK